MLKIDSLDKNNHFDKNNRPKNTINIVNSIINTKISLQSLINKIKQLNDPIINSGLF